MIALIAAVLILLAAFGVSSPMVDLFVAGIGLLALHFAWDFYPWRRGQR